MRKKKKKNEEKRKRLYSERNKYADEETGTRGALCALPSPPCVTSSGSLALSSFGRQHAVSACVCPTCFAPLRRSRNDLMVVTVVLRKRGARPCQVVMCHTCLSRLWGDASGPCSAAACVVLDQDSRGLRHVSVVRVGGSVSVDTVPEWERRANKGDEDALSLSLF